MASKTEFTFAISLSVLDHLGRHLYRSFATVLGEAISNAWDADARNVWIHLDENHKGFCIKDDGIGTSHDDFQNKFLKIGYSKRKERKRSPENRRAFIGRKGIGKLALLSCASRVSIISRISGGGYVGGTIENRQLDKAITDDLTPNDYALASVDLRKFAKYTRNHRRGTIIRFDREFGAGIRGTHTLSQYAAGAPSLQERHETGGYSCLPSQPGQSAPSLRKDRAPASKGQPVRASARP